jgi:hypothetical protein
MTVIKERGLWASARGGVGFLLELLSGNSLIGGLYLVYKQFNPKSIFSRGFITRFLNLPHYKCRDEIMNEIIFFSG